MVPIDYNASVCAFCSKSRRITRDVKASIARQRKKTASSKELIYRNTSYSNTDKGKILSKMGKVLTKLFGKKPVKVLITGKLQN